MTPQELKSSILQLAVQGRLVEQRPEEGTAEELYRQIQEERQRLIKEGKIKKEKPLPEITEDEVPFDIPESWKWVRLGSVGESNIGLTYRPSDKTDSNGTIVLRSSNIQKDKMDYNDLVYVSCEVPNRAMIAKGDILICARNGSRSLVGKSAIVDKDSMAFGAFMAKYCSVCNPFVKVFLDSPAFRHQLDGVKTETINQITQNMIKMQICPLPPLAEQKRIVAKIEELLPYIDRYEKAWNKLEDFNKRFPHDMQKSVLQMAIQGKLVEQRPEEGTGEELYRQIQAEKQSLIKDGKIKKEKPLHEISDDEIPFDIPESWKWVYIGDLFQHNTGKALNSSNKEGSPYSYITTSNVYWNRFELEKLKTMLYTEAELEKCSIAKGDLLVLEGGDVGRAAIWNFDTPMRIQNHIHRLRPYSDLHINFYYFIFMLYKGLRLINGKGIGIKGLSASTLHRLIVPLPPLTEQKRIVAKLDELLPLCERLKQ